MRLQTQLHSDTAGVTQKVTCRSLSATLRSCSFWCKMKSWLHAERWLCLSAPSEPALINSANYTKMEQSHRSSASDLAFLCFSPLNFKKWRPRGHPGLIKSQEYTVSDFKIWWLLINLCHQTIIFYLISPWNVKTVSALLLAVSHSLVCNLVQKKTKREREGENTIQQPAMWFWKQQVLQTGIVFTFPLVLDDWTITNWKYLPLMI